MLLDCYEPAAADSAASAGGAARPRRLVREFVSLYGRCDVDVFDPLIAAERAEKGRHFLPPPPGEHTDARGAAACADDAADADADADTLVRTRRPRRARASSSSFSRASFFSSSSSSSSFSRASRASSSS